MNQPMIKQHLDELGIVLSLPLIFLLGGGFIRPMFGVIGLTFAFIVFMVGVPYHYGDSHTQSGENTPR